MHAALKPITEIIHVNNFMFGLGFEGVDEELARKQLQANANSLTWLLGHTASIRFYLLGLAGVEEESPWGELFESSITKADQSKFPNLGEIKSVWENQSAKLAQGLPNLGDDRLGEPAPFKLPTQEQTILSAISFLTMHESYHIGQVSTQRRMLGIDSLFDLAVARRKAAQA
jgi:uncharacterized damage-inducible protein DinB